jgi:beta-glucosidase-like glycosyl hydrolase
MARTILSFAEYNKVNKTPQLEDNDLVEETCEVCDNDPCTCETTGMEDIEEEKAKGGVSDGLSAQDLADRHGVSLEEIKAAIEAGIKVELEHTEDKELATEIAMDHIFEDPKYYEKLAKIEDEDIEESDDAEEVEAKVKLVSEVLKEAYDCAVKEACTYEGDDYAEHTLETYMSEMSSLNAALAADTLQRAHSSVREGELTIEMYEAACNQMKEAYVKKIDETKESYTPKNLN